MPALRLRARRTGILIPIALATAGVALLAGAPSGPHPGAAGDSYRAGEPATARSALPAGEATLVRARGIDGAQNLGIPTGARSRTARVVDRFAGTVLDELVTIDGGGRRVGIVRMRPDGRVVSAVRLGWLARADRPIGATRAVKRAISLASAARLAADGSPVVRRTADAGWRVSWPRTVDGTPVVGDGTSITLFADGTFHAAAVRERTLAPAPATRLGRTEAAQLARARLRTLLGPEDGARARIVAAHLAWVAPNDTFDASAPDAPAPVLHLAWVVEARTSGSLAARLRALELYLDAGDGDLIGGDLLR
jgi:hypothetical protein